MNGLKIWASMPRWDFVDLEASGLTAECL